MEKIVAEIKKKRELKDIPDSLVKETLTGYLKKQQIHLPENKKERKILIKEIRAELRNMTGQYKNKISNKKLSKIVEQEDFSKILEFHKSTKERLNDYDYVKQIISALNPKTILDLGCGLNPLAIATSKIFYHAYDIKSEDLEIVKLFFKKNNIFGDIHHADIRAVATFPKVDLCLMFKLLDIVGKNKSEIAEDLLKKINTKCFIISFATRTLSGKNMNRPHRHWFENILSKLNYHYKIEQTKQELFYIINKNSQ